MYKKVDRTGSGSESVVLNKHELLLLLTLDQVIKDCRQKGERIAKLT